MKTVFITIFQGVEAKNILRTNVVRELLRQGPADLRLVFFVRTPERAAYYRREFSDPRLIYEAIRYQTTGIFDRLFGFLKFHLIRTTTIDLRRRMHADLSGNPLGYWLARWFNRLLARPSVRRISRRLDRWLVRDRSFTPYFERYRPDLIFLAHLFDDEEISLLREAKRRGVPSIGFVNSWDKLTARCMVRLLPDELLVYNDIVRAEAMTHADMAGSRIRVVGIPQYDLYHGFAPLPREEFLRSVGIAPGKKFILYAPMGEAFSTSDWEIIDLLHRWMVDGALGPDVDLLVRFQPNDTIAEGEVEKRPWLHYDRPGTRFSSLRGTDWDMSQAEMRHLADTLFHTSLLICYASSMSIDAAIFGKPVVNIDFEIKPADRLIKSPTQFYEMQHYQNALQTGGIRMVRSTGELLEWIRRYLENSSFDREGRARLVREQAGEIDGKAGERIAQAILEKMRN